MSARGLLCFAEVIESTWGCYTYKGGMRAISSGELEFPQYNQGIKVDFMVEAIANGTSPQHEDNNVCLYKNVQRIVL